MLRVGIINVTGYIGAEAARLLHAHPEVEVASVTGRSAAGKPIADVYPHLANMDLTIEDEVGEVDAIVSALPHAASAEALRPHIERGTPVVDLSADFRLRNVLDYERWYDTHPAPHLLSTAIFGLPELHREAIAGTKLVAGPGCHATAAILALAPAIKHGLIEPTSSSIAKPGYRVPGVRSASHTISRKRTKTSPAIPSSGHRHLPEMVQELGALWEGPAPRITFVPAPRPSNARHSRDVLRQCSRRTPPWATIPRNTCARTTSRSTRMRRSCALSTAPLRRSRRSGRTNAWSIPCTIRPTGRLIVIACLDNLMKGGAGQGVQCLNLMFGMPEQTGLERLALYP